MIRHRSGGLAYVQMHPVLEGAYELNMRGFDYTMLIVTQIDPSCIRVHNG